jgi:hypothetical protein
MGVDVTHRRPGDDEAGRLGKRVALGLCGAVATWFIVSSTWQITNAVFGNGIVALPSGGPGSQERACVDGLRAQAQGTAASLDTAGQSALASACGESPAALEALAALERLRLAESQLDGRKANEALSIEKLRYQLAEHLPTEMR